MITVAIDSEHTRQTNAGTARYSRSLLKALHARDDIKAIEVGGGNLVKRGTLRKRLLTARQEFLWYPRLGRRSAAAKGADIYHCPAQRAPLTRGKPPLVVTIHDLIPLLAPETMTPWNRFYSRATLRAMLDAADLIVAVSANTANDLNTLLRISASRIRIVWNGVDDIFFSPTSLPAPPITNSYVLFVGTPEPRKNLPRLIEAMAMLRGRGFPHRLVIAGGEGWGSVNTDADKVDFLGRVSDESLRALYAGASCLALPSLHEGFGLTAAEAMAVGTPVLAGARGALPEIVGNAGILVDPYDTGAISRGIERAITERDSLIPMGLARAKLFSWKKAAAEMVGVYGELV
jgi:glycosyltransferase involved in cell wall biosynthesis